LPPDEGAIKVEGDQPNSGRGVGMVPLIRASALEWHQFPESGVVPAADVDGVAGPVAAAGALPGDSDSDLSLTVQDAASVVKIAEHSQPAAAGFSWTPPHVGTR
jgi:hypothetical protein